MNYPNKELLRRGEGRELLGVSEYAFDQLVEAGVIDQVHLRHDNQGRPLGRAFYRTQQIRLVLEQSGVTDE